MDDLSLLSDFTMERIAFEPRSPRYIILSHLFQKGTA